MAGDGEAEFCRTGTRGRGDPRESLRTKAASGSHLSTDKPVAGKKHRRVSPAEFSGFRSVAVSAGDHRDGGIVLDGYEANPSGLADRHPHQPFLWPPL